MPTTAQPMFMAKTGNEVTNTLEIQKRYILTKCGLTILIRVIQFMGDKRQKIFTLVRQEL